MKMQKLIAAFLAIVMAFVCLTACGGVEAPAPENTDGADSGNTVSADSVYVLNSVLTTPELEKAWAEVFTDFETETGIKVEARYQGTWSDYPQILTSAKLAGDPVDLGVTGVGLVQSPLGPGGMIMDITELAAPLIGRYEDGILDSCIMGDKLWLLPLSDGGCTCMLYNKTMFDELGIQVPKSFDEIVAVAATIKEKKNITPMMIHGKDSWAWPMMYFDTYAQATGNQSVENVESFLTGKKQFTGEAEAQAFEWIKMLFDKGVMATDSFDTDSDGMVAAFAQEKVAMIFTLDSYSAYIQQANPDIEIGVMEYPLMSSSAKSEHAFGVGDGAIFVPSFIDDSHLDNAMRLLEFITRPENAGKILNANGATKFKIMKGVDSGKDAIISQLNELIVPNTKIYLDWLWPAEVNDAFCQAIPAVISGTLTSKDASQLVQDAYDTVVAEKGYIYDWWNNFTDEQKADITPDHITDMSSYIK